MGNIRKYIWVMFYMNCIDNQLIDFFKGEFFGIEVII